MKLERSVKALLAVVPLTSVLAMTLVQAQTIAPAADGTGTIVTPQGNRIDISGGQLSGDRANLFHSFTEFGLNANQIANFLSNPQIQTILARVTGGNPSVINGLLQVTGGSSNLFLVNPAGIVFGATASLNVPGSFTATTANGIGFGSNWFNAVGSNDYPSLIGTPSTLVFNLSQPGAIANLGSLAVSTGQSLSLIGGTILNTGTLSAPGGQITLAAIPGSGLVRLSQSGSLLSLELRPEDVSTSLPTPVSLPQLLTGSGVENANGVTVNTDGTIQLTGSGLHIPTATGTVIVSGQLSVASSQPASNPLAPSLQINVLGQQVGLFAATLNASGINGGGTVLIGGDYQGKGTVPNATVTYISPDSKITADSLWNGDGGNVIVWANDSTRFYGSISARGGSQGGNGGFIETSGKHRLDVRGALVDASAPLGQVGTWLLDPEDVTIDTGGTVGGSFGGGNPDVFTPVAEDAIADADAIANSLSTGTSVTITTGTTGAQAGDITVNSAIISSGPGSGVATLTLNAANNIFINAPIQAQSGGTAWNIDLIAGGSIDLAANSNIQTEGGFFRSTSAGFDALSDITTSSFNTPVAGDISINSTGPINAASLIAAQYGGRAGNISLNAGSNDIELLGHIDAQGLGVGASGGNVNITTSGFFQISNPFTDQNGILANISTAGGPGGSITIQHGSPNTVVDVNGNPVTSDTTFTVGGVADTGNGTDAAITTGINNTLSPTQPIPGDFRQGNIQITSVPNPARAIASSDQAQLSADIENEDSENDNGPGDPDDFVENGIGEDLAAGGETTAFGIEDASFGDLESLFFELFLDFLDLSATGELLPAQEAPTFTLNRINTSTGVKPALVYLSFAPAKLTTQDTRPTQAKEVKPEAPSTPERLKSTKLRQRPVQPAEFPRHHHRSWFANWLAQTIQGQGDRSAPQVRSAQDSDQLEIILVTAGGQPIRHQVAGATRGEILKATRQFLSQVSDPRKVRTTSYLAPAQRLYQWLIAPIEPDLQRKGIKNIAIIADTGLRFLPLAALHDGKQFLIEKYSIGLMPSLNLTDTRYTSLKNAKVLAMGAAEFKDQPPLPAVPVELATVTQDVPGQAFLNQAFTPDNLREQHQKGAFQIIHLATHGEFKPGALNNSYIQFWNTKLQLNQIRELGLSNPPVELLVLSACTTALGDDQAELGFAGFAVQSGVKSAIASLWYVSDEGTLGLMSEFYRQLRIAPIKAEALRQAQLAMLRGQVRVEGGQLRSARGGGVALPPILAARENVPLSHPYFWAAFTMIGSPW